VKIPAITFVYPAYEGTIMVDGALQGGPVEMAAYSAAVIQVGGQLRSLDMTTTFTTSGTGKHGALHDRKTAAG